MDSLDEQIRDYLARRRERIGKRPVIFPEDEDFYLFIEDKLAGDRLQKFLQVLKEDPDARQLVSLGRELLSKKNESENVRVPRALIGKAQGLRPPSPAAVCPHCGRPITPFKKSLSHQRLENGLWLTASALCLALSFIIHRYFMQFLLLAALAGLKWIVDQRATKTQIMIYKALKEDDNSGFREPENISKN